MTMSIVHNINTECYKLFQALDNASIEIMHYRYEINDGKLRGVERFEEIYAEVTFPELIRENDDFAMMTDSLAKGFEIMKSIGENFADLEIDLETSKMRIRSHNIVYETSLVLPYYSEKLKELYDRKQEFEKRVSFDVCVGLSANTMKAVETHLNNLSFPHVIIYGNEVAILTPDEIFIEKIHTSASKPIVVRGETLRKLIAIGKAIGELVICGGNENTIRIEGRVGNVSVLVYAMEVRGDRRNEILEQYEEFKQKKVAEQAQMVAKLTAKNAKTAFSLFMSGTHTPVITVDYDGLKVRVVDIARVALYEVYCPTKVFEEYEFLTHTAIPVEITEGKEAMKLLRGRRAKDIVELKVADHKMYLNEYKIGERPKEVREITPYAETKKRYTDRHLMGELYVPVKDFRTFLSDAVRRGGGKRALRPHFAQPEGKIPCDTIAFFWNSGIIAVFKYVESKDKPPSKWFDPDSIGIFRATTQPYATATDDVTYTSIDVLLDQLPADVNNIADYLMIQGTHTEAPIFVECLRSSERKIPIDYRFVLAPRMIPNELTSSLAGEIAKQFGVDPLEHKAEEEIKITPPKEEEEIPEEIITEEEEFEVEVVEEEPAYFPELERDLEELSKKVTELERKAHELSQAIFDIHTDLELFMKRYQEMLKEPTRYEKLFNEQYKSLKEKAEKLIEELDKFKSELNEAFEKHREIAGRISELEVTYVDEDIRKYRQQEESLDQRLKELNRSINIEEEKDELRKIIDILNETKEEFERALYTKVLEETKERKPSVAEQQAAEVRKEVEEVKNLIREMEKEYSEIQPDIEELMESIDTIRKIFPQVMENPLYFKDEFYGFYNRFRKRAHEVLSKLDEIENKYEDITFKIDGINHKIWDLPKDVAEQFKNVVSELRSSVGDVISRYDVPSKWKEIINRWIAELEMMKNTFDAVLEEAKARGEVPSAEEKPPEAAPPSVDVFEEFEKMIPQLREEYAEAIASRRFDLAGAIDRLISAIQRRDVTAIERAIEEYRRLTS